MSTDEKKIEEKKEIVENTDNVPEKKQTETRAVSGNKEEKSVYENANDSQNSQQENTDMESTIKQMLKISSDNQNVIMSLLGNLNQQNERKRIDYSESEEELVEKHDWMDEPAIFFNYSKSWVLSGDYHKNGVVYTPPIDIPLKFETYYRYNTGRQVSGSQSQELVSICRFVTHSRKLKEWLFNHPLFNVQFYLSHEQAAKVDVRTAHHRTNAARSVEGLPDDQIVRMCKQ